MDLEEASKMCAPLPLAKVELVYKLIRTGVCLTYPQKITENGDFAPSLGSSFYCSASLTVRTFSLIPHLNLRCCSFSPVCPVIFSVDVMVI